MEGEDTLRKSREKDQTTPGVPFFFSPASEFDRGWWEKGKGRGRVSRKKKGGKDGEGRSYKLVLLSGQPLFSTYGARKKKEKKKKKKGETLEKGWDASCGASCLASSNLDREGRKRGGGRNNKKKLGRKRGERSSFLIRKKGDIQEALRRQTAGPRRRRRGKEKKRRGEERGTSEGERKGRKKDHERGGGGLKSCDVRASLGSMDRART